MKEVGRRTKNGNKETSKEPPLFPELAIHLPSKKDSNSRTEPSLAREERPDCDVQGRFTFFRFLSATRTTANRGDGA